MAREFFARRNADLDRDSVMLGDCVVPYLLDDVDFPEACLAHIRTATGLDMAADSRELREPRG
jgi:hypothetical protein